MMKLPETGTVIETLLTRLDGLLESTDQLETQTRQNLAEWMKAPRKKSVQVRPVQTTITVQGPLLEPLVAQQAIDNAQDSEAGFTCAASEEPFLSLIEYREEGFDPQVMLPASPSGAKAQGPSNPIQQ